MLRQRLRATPLRPALHAALAIALAALRGQDAGFHLQGGGAAEEIVEHLAVHHKRNLGRGFTRSLAMAVSGIEVQRPLSGNEFR